MPTDLIKHNRKIEVTVKLGFPVSANFIVQSILGHKIVGKDSKVLGRLHNKRMMLQ